ncbi:PaaI family thioesterase [Phenylobacterium sp.]|uniref:PaaI family thioesterase n=1 Tax=Phenylobacterium sp. TaxID=1871053 RepID=UPI00286D4B25|nr:PaaI family thioesterase [Phenylobacterium sp.]
MTWATDRLDQIKAGVVDAPPVVHTLRLGLMDDWGPGWVRKRWDPKHEILNGDGSMFGGYVAALADQILAFATMTAIADDATFRTVNLQLQFMKIGRAHPLIIEGRVVASSRQLITVEADFRREDGELIAKAQAQQIVLPGAPVFR